MQGFESPAASFRMPDVPDCGFGPFHDDGGFLRLLVADDGRNGKDISPAVGHEVKGMAQQGLPFDECEEESPLEQNAVIAESADHFAEKDSLEEGFDKENKRCQNQKKNQKRQRGGTIPACNSRDCEKQRRKQQRDDEECAELIDDLQIQKRAVSLQNTQGFPEDAPFRTQAIHFFPLSRQFSRR